MERRQSTYAAALLIQAVVVSRGTAMGPMGIEYSSTFGGRLRRVVWPRCSVPSAACSVPSAACSVPSAACSVPSALLEVDGGVN